MISTTFLLKLTGATEYQMNIHVPFNQCINISWQHSVHSVLQTSTHHMWEKINTHKLDLSDGPNTNIYIYPDTITERWMLHNCSCWNGKLCQGLFINAQYNLSAFKMSWLQKNIYISGWEAHHLKFTNVDSCSVVLLVFSLEFVQNGMLQWSLRCDRILLAFSDIPKSKKARLFFLMSHIKFI